MTGVSVRLKSHEPLHGQRKHNAPRERNSGREQHDRSADMTAVTRSSRRVSAGRMNPQICCTTTGNESAMPNANAVCSEMSNGSVGWVKANLWLGRYGSNRKLEKANHRERQHNEQARVPSPLPLLPRIQKSRRRNSSTWSSIGMTTGAALATSYPIVAQPASRARWRPPADSNARRDRPGFP